MTCQEFIDFLTDYDDGALPEEQRALFDEHLAICPDCVNYLASYRAARDLGKSAFAGDEDTLSSEVPPELIQAILSAVNQGK